MFVLGITGGIGSGKSTVSSILADRGLLVLDADEISRSVTGPMGRAMPEIAETFGKESSCGQRRIEPPRYVGHRFWR